jgi:hydrogenase nickel incorporation protein HypA/HybF
MHEAHLITDLIKKVESVARENQAKRVRRIRVTLGALSHFTPEHFQEHFDIASPGTLAAGAVLEMTLSADMNHPDAQNVMLESVEVEQNE